VFGTENKVFCLNNRVIFCSVATSPAELDEWVAAIQKQIGYGEPLLAFDDVIE
jgi:hypothetical protein